MVVRISGPLKLMTNTLHKCRIGFGVQCPFKGSVISIFAPATGTYSGAAV